ncbi:MAG: hypothetical protein MAG451_02712 [Anaerolineales bacterium]|nr:hypothetical protein [Anaerolineales bacterium]
MDKAGERKAASFLVRFWLEPRESDNGIRPMRAYIQHLQTGEERYVSDTGLILEYVLHQLRNGHEETASRNRSGSEDNG